jgi:hypothetical protein
MKGRSDVWQFNLRTHAGQHARQPYYQEDFDWAFFAAVAPYKKSSRSYQLLHTWYIPMRRLVTMGCVQTDEGDVGLSTIYVATPGRRRKVIGPRKLLAFPYFEDCCDNPAPMLDELRSGKWGPHDKDKSLVDELMWLP